MAWYQKKPKKTDDFEEKTQTYNEKYGRYDYSLDSRSLDDTFEKTLLESMGDISELKVLVCASNSGYEIGILSKAFPTARFTATDISTTALEYLAEQFPMVERVHADMEHLPFEDGEFDLYLNCRAIHSTDTDIETAVSEAIRVTGGKIVLSVSNGYVIDRKIINGMYDYDSGKIDPGKSKIISSQLIKIFEGAEYSVSEAASNAEIFIIATKNKVYRIKAEAGFYGIKLKLTRLIHKRPGIKRFLKRVDVGHSDSGDVIKHPEGVEIDRTFDRKNDHYYERVTDVKTGKITREIGEPLSRHISSAHKRRENNL